MAGRSKKLEDDSRRFRTLLQSVDTARYHADRQIDRKTDIDQARTEILSAVLFGHEIIIPAGVVADCPAVHVLLPEVLKNFERARRRIFKYNGRRYFPFRIGVERRFADRDPRGYDAFVRDYIDDPSKRIAPNVELSESVERDRVRQTIVRLGQAYLARRWDEIRAINSRFAEYFELVYENFGEESDRTPRPVTARDGALTSVPQDYYAAFVRDCCRNIEARKVEYDHVEGLRATTQSLRHRMAGWEVDTGQRGSWYGLAEEYGEQWHDIRGWFDHALYQRMVGAFGIDIPSYFTQEIGDDAVSREVSLAFLDPHSLHRFRSDLAAGQAALPPAASQVNWGAIWETVSEHEVQDAIRSLHLKLLDARDVLRTERHKLAGLEKQKREQRASILLKEYRQRSFAAIDAHIVFLNSGQSGLTFKQQNNRLMVDAHRPHKGSGAGRRLVTNMIGTGVGMAAALDPNLPGLIAAPLALGTTYLSDLADRTVAQTVIDHFKRPKANDVKVKQDFYAAERSRVNYWFSNG